MLHYLYGTKDKVLTLRPANPSAGIAAVRLWAYADCDLLVMVMVIVDRSTVFALIWFLSKIKYK